MKSYLLSILGVVFVGVFIDIILPSGQTSKYIKGIFSIFIVFVIINPIITFVKKDFDLKNYFDYTVSTDEKLLNYLYNSKVVCIENDIEEALNSAGLKNVDIKITFTLKDDNIFVQRVDVNLKNLVIENYKENINKYDYIRKVILSKVLIEEEAVVFSG